MTSVKLPRLVSFESRRADEMCSLISRFGGIPISAPSMRELPVEDNPEAIAVIRSLIEDRFHAIILLTGVGTTALFELAQSQNLCTELHAALRRLTVIIRGPKPAAVLSKAGIPWQIRAPEPNTWRELLAAIDQSELLPAKSRIVVQEYGLPNERLYSALESRSLTVTRCPVYRWAFPEDTKPLEEAIRQIADRQVDAVLFTSANQVSSVLAVADRMHLAEEFRRAIAERTLVASVGPTCSEAISDNAMPVHCEASPPKMGPLVRTAMETLKTRGYQISECE